MNQYVVLEDILTSLESITPLPLWYTINVFVTKKQCVYVCHIQLYHSCTNTCLCEHLNGSELMVK